jgi:hypothetical protein
MEEHFGTAKGVLKAGLRALTRRSATVWIAGSFLAVAASAGGADSSPRFTGLTRSGNNVTLSWYGPRGPLHPPGT